MLYLTRRRVELSHTLQIHSERVSGYLDDTPNLKAQEGSSLINQTSSEGI